MHTKIRWWLLGLALLVIVVAGRIVYSNIQGQTGLAEIQRRGELRVGLDASFPPFEFLDGDGQVVGLDADIAHAIAKDLGVDVVFVNIGFDGLYDALLAQRVDILISGLPVDPHLTEDVAYSINYFNAGQALVTSNPQIDTIEDLAGQSVAVEWGSLADMEARRLQTTMPDIQINPQPDPQAVLTFDISIVDGVTARGASDKRIVEYLTFDWYAVVVNIDNRALLEQVNKTLSRLLESGEMARLEDKWFQ